MRTLAKLWRLTWPDRVALAEAWCRLWVLALALRWRSFPSVVAMVERRRAQTRPGSAAPQEPSAGVERLGRWVDAAARYHPLRTRCLHRSLALKWMLAGRGIDADLRIGVRREGEELAAHAWLERDGVRLGSTGRTAEAFAPLAPPGAVRRAQPLV